MPTPELETAEEFAKRLERETICGMGNPWLDRKKSPAMVAARDAAIALKAKRELLEEIRTAANEFLVGKGLTISPCEAIGGAVQDAAIKYAEPSGRKEE